jgi:hypothetical protein
MWRGFKEYAKRQTLIAIRSVQYIVRIDWGIVNHEWRPKKAPLASLEVITIMCYGEDDVRLFYLIATDNYRRVCTYV